MRIFITICATLLLATLASCSGADILNATVPRTGYTLTKNIPYGTHPRQTLDIYAPETPSRAVIVFFYGGSWKSGSKDIYRFVGQAFASKGYTVVIPDYRIYPEVRYPTFLEDSAQAVAWTHSHISEYAANPKNIFLAGHSAGAYNAVSLALNETYLHKAGYNPKNLRGVMALAGPYDFLPFTDPDIIQTFSTAYGPETQPISYAGKNKPPLLLMHGDADEDVLLRNSNNLATKLKEFHSPIEQRTYGGVGHYGIIISLSPLFRYKSPAFEDMQIFLRQRTQ